MSERNIGDDFVNDPLFSELRAFAKNPVETNPHELKRFQSAFRGGILRRNLKMPRSLGISAIAAFIALPTMAYAGLLPDSVSHGIKSVFHAVGSVVVQPAVAERTATPTAATESPSPAPSDDAATPSTVPSIAGSDESFNENNATEQDNEDGSAPVPAGSGPQVNLSTGSGDDQGDENGQGDDQGDDDGNGPMVVPPSSLNPSGPNASPAPSIAPSINGQSGDDGEDGTQEGSQESSDD